MSENISEDKSDMEYAVESYLSTPGASIRGIADLYDVSASTLGHRIAGRNSRRTVHEEQQKLAPVIEDQLAKWIINNDYAGYAPTYDAIAYMAKELDPSHSTPGAHWVQRFMRRHPDLKACRDRPIDQKRWIAEDIEVLKRWFREIHALIERLDLRPDQIFNCDEKGFQMGATKGRMVVCHRPRPGATSIMSDNSEWVSILECISAAGLCLQPLVIMKGKNP